VEGWGWKAPFIIGGIFSFIGMILSFYITEHQDKQSREPMKLKVLISVIKEPSLLKISLLSILAHSIIFSTMFGFTSNYALEIGYSPRELTWNVFAFMIPHAIATLFMGSVLVPRLGEWRSLKIAFLFTSLSTIMIPFVEQK